MSNSLQPRQVPGFLARISQARILEQVATPSSRGSSLPRDWKQADSLPLHHLGSPPNFLALKANLAPHPTILYSFAQIKGTTQTYKAPRSELQIPCRQKPVGFIWALGLHWPDQQWLGAESKGPQSTLLEGK